jgi:putative NADH-flavin reductase
MQITILGAAGNIGKAVITEAIRLGYQVKVLVRSPDKLGELQHKVEVVKGNLLESSSVEKALEGSKAVINVSGAVNEPDQIEKFQQIAKILVENMKQLGISRLINISLAVIALPDEKLNLQRKLLRIFVNLFYKQKKRVQEEVMKVILSDVFISWTLVRPAMVSAKPGTGRVLANDKHMEGTTITLEDLGRFMVEQIASTEWIKKAPFVASK